MTRMPSPKSLANLKKAKKTITTTERARELGRLGGMKSQKVYKEKKLLSSIYADILADQSGIKGGKGFSAVVAEIMNNAETKNNSARVSLMKEIADRTEGAGGSGSEAAKKDADLLSALMGAPSTNANQTQGE